jgi:hypothetical protein
MEESDRLRVYEFDVSFKDLYIIADDQRYFFQIFLLPLNIKENNITCPMP